MYHKTVVIGYVGQDPEKKFLPNGTAVVNTSIAATEKWRDRQTNEKREKTTWYRLSIFGKRGEAFADYVEKGTPLRVEGTVETRAYMGNDGEPRASLNLKVDDWMFLPGSSNGNASNNGSGNRRDTSDDYAPPSGGIDDIPF